MTNDDWRARVSDLLKEADESGRSGRTEHAIETFEAAYDLIPEPKHESELAMIALAGIGELHFLQGETALAFEDFAGAVMCREGLGNPHIHLRLGQLQLGRGNTGRAQDELMRAYMGAGDLIFEGEDPRYYELIREFVET